MALNAEDGADRRFILIQLPEPTDLPDYPTVADLSEERVRRAMRNVLKKENGKLNLGGAKLDLGFRVFKLAQSNINEWDSEIQPDATTLEEQLALVVDHLRPGRSDADILYEVILKSGYPLSAKVRSESIEGKTVYSVSDGAFLICLERSLTLSLVRAIGDRRPERVLFLDEGFAGNDQLKANSRSDVQNQRHRFSDALIVQIQFDPNQTFQLDAIEAVAGLFDGQPRGEPEFSVIRLVPGEGLFAGQERSELGIGNRLLVGDDTIRQNLRGIQRRNDIDVADENAAAEGWELFE